MDYSHFYYKHQRPELLQHIQPGQNKILDVGCAEGLLGESLKKRGLAAEVIGIELFPDAAKVAETRLDRVICRDIELPNRDGIGLEPASFDYIICGDVLEHLREPWAVLSWLATRLKPGGRLIASVPNVRYWSVVLPLLFLGRWQYKNEGILDRTHLRFFTKQSVTQLVEQSGLDVLRIDGISLRKIDKVCRALPLGSLTDLSVFQWLLVGVRR